MFLLFDLEIKMKKNKQGNPLSLPPSNFTDPYIDGIKDSVWWTMQYELYFICTHLFLS